MGFPAAGPSLPERLPALRGYTATRITGDVQVQGREQRLKRTLMAAGSGVSTPGAAVPASLLTRLWPWLYGSKGRSRLEGDR